MSLFIAGQAFPVAGRFRRRKIAVFGASVLSAVIGVVVLWSARQSGNVDDADARSRAASLPRC